MPDPRAAYQKLLKQRQREAAELERRHAVFGYWRLAIALAAMIIVWLALAGSRVSILWLFAPAAAFAVVAIVHERRLRLLELRRRAQRYFEKAILRLDGDWAGHGESGERYLDLAHPYAQDLDLFGKGSLFELLCTARTHIGEDTLARWLLAPADPETARQRQAAIEELRPRLDLREQLAVVAEEARKDIEPGALAAWGEAPGRLESRGLRRSVWALRIFGILGLAAGICALLKSAGGFPMPEPAAVVLRDLFLAALVVNGLFYYRNHARFEAVAGAVDQAAHQLGLLSDVLALFERERFTSPWLAQLRASLDSEGAPPSKRLKRLKRIMENLDSRENMLLKSVEIFILWTPYWAVQVENWRRHSGRAVRRWLDATGEIEALCSLASHAFEHPNDTFAEFAEEGPWLDAEAAGHPLIAETRVVRNSVRLGGDVRVMIVSGSNMSGKSTLLRTLGTNVVLAQAGATVRAKRLRISRLAVGASIRVNDSLQGGVSRFYAEILRLRQILDQTSGGLPVLFLIDEFMHGTNSHDRRIGANAMVRSLVARGAIGLITTHDLALADIAQHLGSSALNVHFEDHVEDGQIHFDYVMRPGVVRKSNAIELMRSVGLEI
jgi:hypothetical protein